MEEKPCETGTHLGIFQSCCNGVMVIKCRYCDETWTVPCTHYKNECSEKIIRESNGSKKRDS